MYVKNLKKSFGSVELWNDLTTTFNPGEIVSIQGKSGEGKTTFLRCLNNLEKVDGGTIDFGDYYLCKDTGSGVEYNRDLSPLHSNIGMVFQNFNLFNNLNIYENIALALEYKKVEKSAIDKIVYSLVDELELREHLDKYPWQLSGGQKQRVAIARASALEPKVLTFDEPTSALDEKTREQIEKILKDLRDKGIIILVVTHDSEFAKKISNRILHIENGVFREEVNFDL